MLAIYLLGSFQVRLYNQPLLRLETGKTGALLAYLATEIGKAHSRRTLAELLWPDRSNTEALSSLRFALSNLRAVLQDRQSPHPILLIDRSQVRLNAQANIWVDVSAFQDQVIKYETSVRNGTDLSLEAIKTTLALYRGHFLKNFNFGDSLEFETWALYRREQFERQYIYSFQLLAQRLEAIADFSQAEEAYRAILELQPWDENIHRRIMQLLTVNGQYGAALAQYEVCCRALRELEIEPGRETNLLFHHIKKEQASPSKTGVWSQESLDEQSAQPFVFRERELNRLDAFLTRVLAGQRQIAFITGEAGSGKTALMHEFAGQALARHPQLLVVGGRCDSFAGLGQPFQPFIESVQVLAGEWGSLNWAEQLTSEGQERLQQAVPLVAQALVKFSPDLLDRFIDRSGLALRLPGRDKDQQLLPPWQKTLNTTPAVPAVSVGLETQVLFEQVTNFFQEITRKRPLVLLLDDLQWADPGSLSLLFHLSRRLALGGCRLFIVGAYRPHDLLSPPSGAAHPLLPLVRELQRDFGDIELDLERAAGRPFIDALLDAEPNALDESFRARLSRATGGHALFTVELVREMRGQGGLVRDETGRWIESSTLNWGQLPARVEGVIAGRLERLPAARLALLSAASVEGETFSAEVLAGALNLDEAHVLNELNGTLSRSRLVRALGLERPLASSGQRPSPSSEQPSSASSSRRLSYFTFQHALFQTYLYNQLNAIERIHLHEAVGYTLERFYGEESAVTAAQLARHFENARLPEKAADYLLLAGQRAYRLAASKESIALYHHALNLLDASTSSALVASTSSTPAVSADSATALAKLGPNRARRELDLQLALYASLINVNDRGDPEQDTALERAYKLAENLDDPKCMFQVLRNLIEVKSSQGKIRQALSFARQFMNLTQQTREVEYMTMGHYLVSTSYFLLGELAPARAQLEKALVLYHRQFTDSSNPSSPVMLDLAVQIQAWLSLAFWAMGFPDQALAHNQEVLVTVKSARTPLMAISLSSSILILHAVSRRAEGVRECTELLQLLIIEKNLVALQPWLSFYQGWLLVHGDQVQDKEIGLAQIRTTLSSLTAIRPYRLMILAEACLLTGHYEDGQKAVDEALALAAETNSRMGEAEVFRLRGDLILAINSEQKKEAIECYQRAIEIAQQQEAKSWELRAKISLARLWAGQGRTEEARELMAGIYDWFTEGFSMPDLVEARELLVELGRST